MKTLVVVVLTLFFTLARAEDNIKMYDVILKSGVTKNHSTTVYLNIDNLGDELDYLLSIKTINYPEAVATINKTVIEKNVARIIKIDRLAIPAHSTVKLIPSGIHIVITGLPIGINDNPIKLGFNFAKYGDKILLLQR